MPPKQLVARVPVSTRARTKVQTKDPTHVDDHISGEGFYMKELPLEMIGEDPPLNNRLTSGISMSFTHDATTEVVVEQESLPPIADEIEDDEDDEDYTDDEDEDEDTTEKRDDKASKRGRSPVRRSSDTSPRLRANSHTEQAQPEDDTNAFLDAQRDSDNCVTWTVFGLFVFLCVYGLSQDLLPNVVLGLFTNSSR